MSLPRFRRRLIAWAAGFLALSYAPYGAPRRASDLPGLTIFWTVWCSTAIILCDANWPLENVSVCGVPVLVLLLWPAQYVVFLSFWSLFTGAEVWR